MPIVVSHQPDFGVVGASALAAGYGQYRQRQQDIALEQANRDADRRMQLYGMQQDQFNRNRQAAMAMQQAQLGRQHDFQMADFQDWQDANKHAAMWDQQQQRANQQAEQQKELFDYQWTAKQRAELERFNNYEQSIRSSPHLSEPEKQNLLIELEGQRAGFRPMAVPKQHQPTVQEKIDQGGVGMWTHPQSGQQIPVTVDRSGALKFEDVPESPEMKAQQEQIKQQSVEYKAKIDAWKLQLDYVKERGAYIRDRVADLTMPEPVGPDGQPSPKGMDMAAARLQAQQEFDSLAPPPPQFEPPPSPVREQQAAFGQQGGVMQPIPQGWQAGTPMGPPSPQGQTQIGAQFSQQQPMRFSAALGREVSDADIEQTAREEGISVAEVKKRLRIQ